MVATRSAKLRATNNSAPNPIKSTSFTPDGSATQYGIVLIVTCAKFSRPVLFCILGRHFQMWTTCILVSSMCKYYVRLIGLDVLWSCHVFSEPDGRYCTCRSKAYVDDDTLMSFWLITTVRTTDGPVTQYSVTFAGLVPKLQASVASFYTINYNTIFHICNTYSS